MTDLQWDRGFALEQAGDDEELLAELLTLLRDSAAGDLKRMQEAAAAGDGRALADAAHNTKGAAASLGIENLRRAAQELEEAGRAGEPAHALELLPRFARLLDQLADIH